MCNETKYRLMVCFYDGAWDWDEFGEIRFISECFEQLYDTEEQAKEWEDYYKKFYGDELDFTSVDKVHSNYIIR